MCGSVDANGKVHFTTILYTYTYDSLSMGYVAVLNAHPLIIDMTHKHTLTHANAHENTHICQVLGLSICRKRKHTEKDRQNVMYNMGAIETRNA